MTKIVYVLLDTAGRFWVHTFCPAWIFMQSLHVFPEFNDTLVALTGNSKLKVWVHARAVQLYSLSDDDILLPSLNWDHLQWLDKRLRMADGR